MLKKEKFMKEAIKQAKKAYDKEEIPVGAVIVKDGKIIARGYNKKEEKKDNKKVLEFNFKDFPILAIWSLPGAPYICLEPWFNYADRVKETGYFKDKEGVITLSPKEEFDCEFNVKFF